MKKKTISAILCAAMAATVLPGCGSSDSAEETSQTAGSTAAAAEDGTASVVDGNIDTIVVPMATLGDAPSGLEDVEKAINEITEPEIGVDVVFEPIPFSDLTSQETLMISSGDQLDLVLSLWSGGIGSFVEKNAVIDMGDLLETYGQGAKDAIGINIAGGYYNGTLYAIPDAELSGNAYGFEARKDYCDELGFTFDATKTYTIEDLESLFAAFKEKYGDGYYCVAGTGSSSDFFVDLYGHTDTLGASYASGALIDCLDKSDTTVTNIYASDEYMTYAKKMYEWAQKGYFASDAATNTDSGTTQVAAGNYLGQFNNTCYPSLNSHSTAFSTAMYMIPIVSPYATTGMYQQVLWGISSSCEHPEKAMALLNMMYSDTRINDLFTVGIEGVSYEVVEQGDQDYEKVIDFPEGITSMNSPYYLTLGVYGNHNTMPVWTPETLDYYTNVKDFNALFEDEDKQSVALNYAYNYSNYPSEYSAVSAVVQQYSGAIACGAVDPEKEIPEFLKALEAAGIDSLIADNQSQLDAFLAQ